MKISSVFFFRYYLSFLFISSQNQMKTRITEKNITGRNIEEEVIRILKGYVYIYYMYFPRRSPPKIVILVKYY